MKNTLKQVFHSPKFVVGFVIFGLILLTMLIYPMINPGDPLQMIGVGTFAKPGTYVSVYDTVGSRTEIFRLPEAEANRIAKKLTDADRVSMVEWFTKAGIDVSGLDITDTDTLLDMWNTHFEDKKLPGMTNAVRRNYRLLDTRIKELQAGETLYVAEMNEETKLLEEKSTISKNDYVNLKEIANVKVLPLGTDNFGRDVLKELVSACGTSILIGLIAGAVATLIGLTFGLLAGYLGGIYDDIIMFVTNVFTVIPGFILLILISYSIGQDQRGATVVALVIGLTSWTWTARSVRSQVISLRNRDHVNLSKLSGHSLLRIILTDILPYIASYVVMA
ncbi:MAG: ABC transporter permease, partial [Clostridia bacterium]|nr:ABC transporter permease [Clostridia bacterium]